MLFGGQETRVLWAMDPEGQGGQIDVQETASNLRDNLWLKPLVFHKHFYFPVPRFPYLYTFSGVQGPGEKETIKTMCIVPGQGGPIWGTSTK